MNSGDCFYDEQVLEHLANRQLTQDIIVGRDYHYNAQTGQGFATILPNRISMLTFYIQTLPHQSSFFRRELFKDSPYDENLKIVSDIKFYIQKLCIENSSIVLLDDIYDTGATLKEVGKLLTQKGAKYIVPIVIAKTVGGSL
jgi:phosphoribosylpyrophosphate synthetase